MHTHTGKKGRTQKAERSFGSVAKVLAAQHIRTVSSRVTRVCLAAMGPQISLKVLKKQQKKKGKRKVFGLQKELVIPRCGTNESLQM